jgi:hypothetical protein
MDEAFNKSRVPLPLVIESAIEFLECLSERYLWVDALCIVQDDEVDVADQISKMDVIYSHSYATLIAATVTSSRSQLLGLPGSPRYIEQKVEAIQGCTYIAESFDLENRLSKTVWNTRGWTYQERELSLRRIFVFDDECFFECAVSTCQESLTIPSITRDRFWWMQMESIPSLLDEFFASVGNYTTRKFTNPNDISNAFAGLCAAIQNNGLSMIIHGMPVIALDQSIFWEISGLPDRRLATFSHQGSTWTFPSWSWMGWVGTIQYNSSRTYFARLEIEKTTIQIQRRLINSKWLFGMMETLDCWVDCLMLKGWLATFRISHRDIIIQRSASGDHRNDIGWRIVNKASKYCGVAKFTGISFEDVDGYYDCLLISRNQGPEAAMHDMPTWLPPTAVTLQSQEEILKYQNASYHPADRPPRKQADIFLPFEMRDWAYLNVLILRFVGAENIYERIGTGEIHEDAWVTSGPTFRYISII